ncbi:hypothetical protein K2173_013793 [Erythroxylum novogranatense]|uniref:Late embryogenesis abundant protein LEA-2 subgroup domain-containing protein n=1 Tax=Erythroxylum novogranatense TaxID=1862640 RepID=A0AAV8SCH4_9ROSI|nr:hypothetical protein K2173_013793 [Erythroxylum novogranatense]
MQDPSRPTTGYPPPNGNPTSGTAGTHHFEQPYSNNNSYFYYYNNQQHQPSFYSDHGVFLLRRLVVSVIAVTVIFFTILVIMWLAVRPRLPDFQLTSLSVSNFNLSSSSQTVTGNWHALFRVYNPNKKMKISYDVVDSSVLYRSEILSQTRVVPFKQDTRSQSLVEASYSVVNTYVDGWVVSDINGERSRGSVGFNVKVVANVGFKVGGFGARRRLLRVFCDDVSVGVTLSSKSGNLTGGTKDCRVYA